MTHRSHELALCIINDSGDGPGPRYGTSYRTRAGMGRKSDPGPWLTVALVGAEAYNRKYGTPGDHYSSMFPASDLLLAAAELAEYYTNHAAECDALTNTKEGIKP
ncbi:hypothetical protein LCGC14_1396640 [marine sediment metagenome]|uniref:Uncharacterized protein n=1 Tax=marine sediment metagenome TaxID=412755 RepID=A0A0F9KJC1_9ZZZZ